MKRRHNSWKMDDLQQAAESLLDQLNEQELQEILPKLAEDILADLKRSAPSMLREHKKLRHGFAKRNYRRWQKGFDQLYMLIVMSEEIGQAIDNAVRPSAAQNFKFEAISHLHGRAFLIAREILCLMKGGFADGALGRWRTLHEVAVISHFLQAEDQITARRYLLSRDIRAYKAARQYREYETAANLTPFGDKEFEQIATLRDTIIADYGKEMENDWGWAAIALGNDRPTFADIEKHCGLDHWRPRYKWASQDTHGNHRPTLAMLALCEKMDDTLSFPAESNSGMTDPAHMTAISLILATNAHIQLEPNLDRLIGLMAMRILGDEIGETFLRLEAETFAAHVNRRRWFRF